MRWIKPRPLRVKTGRHPPISPSGKSSWREDNRRVSWDQVNRITALALKRGKSADFTVYWQRQLAN